MSNAPDDPKSTVASSFISRVRQEQMIMERVELLEQAPLFSVLHPGDLQVLASRFHPVRYGRGEVIFREGEPAERLFLMNSGRVKLSIASPSGQEIAQMIGVTRESANRLVASFAGRGWISWNDGYPILLEPEALIRRAR